MGETASAAGAREEFTGLAAKSKEAEGKGAVKAEAGGAEEAAGGAEAAAFTWKAGCAFFTPKEGDHALMF